MVADCQSYSFETKEFYLQGEDTVQCRRGHMDILYSAPKRREDINTATWVDLFLSFGLLFRALRLVIVAFV